MNPHRRSCEHLDHYQRNGTYLRVLLAVPTNDTSSFGLLVDDDCAIDTSRIVILTASTLHGLDEHTARLQTAAAEVDWELRPAHGLHRRIIERIRSTTKTEQAHR